MTRPVIPSQLQNKLAELTTRKLAQPIFIETGVECLDVVVARMNQIEQKQKNSRTDRKTLASRPSLLILLSPEYLETTKAQPGVSPCSSFTCLSESQSPRDDISALGKPSGVLITTPQRAIDHIRRDNIFLAETKTVLIAYGFTSLAEETKEEWAVRQKAFLDDLQFVFTKLSPTVQIEFYVDDFSHLSRQPMEIVEQAALLARADWETSAYPLEFRVAPITTAKTVTDVLYSFHASHYFVVYREEKEKRALSTLLRKERPPLSTTLISYEQLRIQEGPHTPLSGMVVAFGLELEEIITLIRRSQTWSKTSIEKIVCIISPRQESDIPQSKETMLMNNETKRAPEAMDVLAGKIQLIASKVRIDSNPEELDTYKKLIKKNVPFLLRGYFMAYLLRETLSSTKSATVKDKPDPRGKVQDRPAKETAASKTPRPKKEAGPVAKREAAIPQDANPKAKESEKVEVVIPEGAKTLYLNIGKMKRLYARELSQILQTELGITREDIYSIRIHDKYSFITVSEEHAELAIAKLNGMDIKGRTAAVSYSNKE